MHILIRKISSEDVEAITALTEQLGYAFAPEQMLLHIKNVLSHDDTDAFVAEHEGRVIGWIGLAYRIQIESAPFCEINGLVVDEAFRGNKIGRSLIEKAKSWTRENGCDRLRLRTNVTRHDAHRFYSSLGFNEVKQQKVFEVTV